jgi:hypothetical protein
MSLPSNGYKLIIWRAHSALDLESKYIAISTSEKYDSRKYSQYLENGQLTLCNITDQDLLFGITPKFVEERMTARFEDTVIIFMSCNGLKQNYYKTAEAFAAKGAKVFISWDGWILPPDNDDAMTLMLQYLISDNNTIQEAVQKIPEKLSQLGPSRLRYHPLEASDYRIPDYKHNTGTSSAAQALTSVRKKSPKPKLD